MWDSPPRKFLFSLPLLLKRQFLLGRIIYAKEKVNAL